MTGNYPVAQAVTLPARADTTKPNPTTGWTLASREAQIGPARRLAEYPAPGTEPIPSYWENAKGLTSFFEDPSDPITGKLEAKGIPKEVAKKFLQHEYEKWAKAHWRAPVQPTYSQTAEFLKLWDTSEHPQAALLSRGFAIEKDIVHARGARRERLLSALSSLSLVLTYKTFGDVYGPTYLPEGGALR
jgi:hypothetical protein